MRTLVASAVAAGIFLTALPLAAEAPSLDEVFRRVNGSVVVIKARGRETSGGRTVGFTETGAGVLVSADGKVVTAAHVVQGTETISIEVLGDDPAPARVLLFEPKADLALLQIEGVSPDATVAKLADSDHVRAGETVFVVGAPYGLRHSLSVGVISARWALNTVNADFPLSEFFQTDAAINTGNSGGPMFNSAGEVIGIVSHIISKSGGNEGLGFVATSNTAKRVLLDRTVVWAGVEGRLVSDDLARSLKLPQPAGYLVTRVVAGSDGAALGLKGGTRPETVAGQDIIIGGDVILKAQGIQVSEASDVPKIRAALSKAGAGQEVAITVLRDGRATDLKNGR
ncbi:MAG TPA: trypsin-like peptidase domain-containing protein [Candidatus Methylomirabilis sp.]|nr:trypsin-like peptidase domain-containing protein [Candidatus Methylomirabilis sp.]